ncbi:sodium-dependent bicarbonate transport family permease [Leptospira bandrabouensis]|uniref:Sodium-dependent bicarbonate transport family permease n=1 Tax=Leptospira bandrabouensis TaxID=2484903 RepID=A0A6H3NST4_9LEPT|nr:sodium-dependent bicarbonate transport family permease [Leptospira bandrabouensis]MCG6144400.1 sodium-dependent bicarbonate transport family permease [Leptospira bandrabouensis]MCG6150589.1 sodium-dependent bicarbonate transport family permease [Leptospira bandrabouensis]MCG6160061.1 sodium-dependent bicarbonate transport family permease [Leptospira bandrabouensis]MCG6163994.1 sodium-dependent bicarbonate transport family permease [Leptospira bandrabouensis]MCW7456897.1 sodium-dependent bic
MDFHAALTNILNPPVLFFFLGMGVVFFKSDLRITEGVSKFLSLYLLFSIGFKGGHELFKSPFAEEHLLTLIACMFMACFVPIYSYFIFRAKLDHANSAALAGSFGSISAVTFVTAGAFLHSYGYEYQGFIVAGMALMESPAIVLAVILDRLGKKKNHENINEKIHWKQLLHEAFFSSSVYILIGALIVGYLSGESGWNTTKPFTEDIFKGLLTFFLLDKGIDAAKQMRELKKVGFFLVGSALLIMVINVVIAILLTKIIQMPIGDALMFVVLCASASYIAVPAAMKESIPEANPSIYLTVALSIVFPINIIIGIPLYFYILKVITGAN